MARVERGPAVDVYDLRVDLDVLPDDERVPLMTLGEGPTEAVVAIRRVGDGQVRRRVLPPGTSGAGAWASRPRCQARSPCASTPISASGDRWVSVGATCCTAARCPPDTETPEIGRFPAGYGSATRFPGEIEQIVPELSLCERAVDLDD